MNRYVRALLAATCALGLVAGTSPSSSSPNVVTMVGTGTYSPGLPTTGCAFQSVSFDGTAAFAGTHAGVYALHFDGSSSTCESLTTGSGSGTLSGQVTGNLTYSRTGTVVTLSGSFRVNGGPEHAIAAVVCVPVPTSVNPQVTYMWVCALTVA